MKDLKLVLDILGAFCLLTLIFLVFVSPFVYLCVEERKYRKWEKSQKK